jgi:hypothetical protein
MRILLYVILFGLLSSCSVHKFNNYQIQDAVEHGWETEEYNDKAKIIVNTRREYVILKYGDVREKYEIESYKYKYPLFTIFKFRKDRKGISIICKNGYYIKIYYDDDAYIDIPSDDNDDLTKTRIYLFMTYEDE